MAKSFVLIGKFKHLKACKQQEESRMKWVERYSNLIVLRTFSKSAALAGIRVGYGAFPLDLVSYIWRAKQPYNVSVASETAACAALTNKAYLQV